MADEEIEIFDLQNNSLGFQDRKKFYEEIKSEHLKTGTITKKIKVCRILVLNTGGRIYLQKRSNLKSENAGLYDKTVGGHISKGETQIVTVIRECAEELGFPVAVLADAEFDSVIKSIDTEVIGVLKQIAVEENCLSKRKSAEGDFIQPQITYFYIGYYDGGIKFRDGESSGIETFSLEELKREMSTNPERFTQDLRDMISKFESYLQPLR